jgi:hypothetical protein
MTDAKGDPDTAHITDYIDYAHDNGTNVMIVPWTYQHKYAKEVNQHFADIMSMIEIQTDDYRPPDAQLQDFDSREATDDNLRILVAIYRKYRESIMYEMNLTNIFVAILTIRFGWTWFLASNIGSFLDYSIASRLIGNNLYVMQTKDLTQMYIFMEMMREAVQTVRLRGADFSQITYHMWKTMIFFNTCSGYEEFVRTQPFILLEEDNYDTAEDLYVYKMRFINAYMQLTTAARGEGNNIVPLFKSIIYPDDEVFFGPLIRVIVNHGLQVVPFVIDQYRAEFLDSLFNQRSLYIQSSYEVLYTPDENIAIDMKDLLTLSDCGIDIITRCCF